MNTITIVGNLGKSPELTEFASGTKLLKFSLAENQYRKDEAKDKQEPARMLTLGRTCLPLPQMQCTNGQATCRNRHAAKELLRKDDRRPKDSIPQGHGESTILSARRQERRWRARHPGR